MELDRTICYRALKSRDARFDGRFFTGVKTRGIYCRPICPARLVAIPGIGEWTTQCIAMRAFGEPDAFLSGDLGLQKACADGNGSKLSERNLLARAEAWRPWRAYAAMYLWASLSD